MMAFGALRPHEAMLQTATFEVVGKFRLYMQGLGPALRGHYISEVANSSVDLRCSLHSLDIASPLPQGERGSAF
jgi:hypothetical protein